MKSRTVITLLVLDFLIAAVVVAVLYFQGTTEGLVNDLFGVLFVGLLPLLGGVNGLFIAGSWGGFKSAVGRALIFLSLGLISWALGTYLFSGVYNLLLHVEVPYPSIADVGYILALPLWAIGIVELSRATGAKYGLRSTGGKFLLFLIPLLIIVASYYLLVVVARGGSIPVSDSELLKLFFDFAYPLGDVIILSLATLIYGLSLKFFGGVYKHAVYLILIGFGVLYFADFAFSYTTTLETFYPGDWVDLLFAAAMLLLSSGVALFDPKSADPQTVNLSTSTP